MAEGTLIMSTGDLRPQSDVHSPVPGGPRKGGKSRHERWLHGLQWVTAPSLFSLRNEDSEISARGSTRLCRDISGGTGVTPSLCFKI